MLQRRIAILATVALFVAACGGGSGGGETASSDCPVDALANATAPVELEIWQTLTGQPQRAMEVLVEQYNASQDKVVVKLVNQGVGYEEIQRKFNTAISERKLGGLVILEDTQTQFMADSGVIVPAQNCFDADPSVNLDDFSPVVRNFYSVDGALQPASSNLSTGVMYYNRDHLAEAGLNPDAPPQTLDEVRDAAIAIQAAGITEKPFVMLLQPWFVEHWLTGSGVSIVNENNGRDGLATESTFNNATTLELYTWLADMNQRGLLNAVPGTEGQLNHYLAMANQDASITIETSTAISTIDAVLAGTLNPADVGLDLDSIPAFDIDVDVAPYPGLTGPGQVQAGSGAWYIPNTNSDEVIAAAWDFMKWFNSPAIQAQWVIGSTYNPWNDLTESEPAVQEWEATTRPGRWLSVAVEEIDNLDPNFPGPLIGPYTDVRTAIRKSLDELLLKGGTSPEQVVADTDAAITQALKDYEDTDF